MSDAALAQDPNELFDVVRADGTPTGRIKPRAAVHRDGDWHRALHVWITGVGSDGVPFLLFQRRSLDKDTWPGRLDATVGGHFRAGEGITEALREIEEELGVPAPPLAELRLMGVRVCANEGEPGFLDRELQDVFLWRSDAPLTVYAPNPAELAALVRFPLQPLLDFQAGSADSVEGISSAPGRCEPVAVVARAADFIPTVDRYFYRVAIAAERALAGERHIAV